MPRSRPAPDHNALLLSGTNTGIIKYARVYMLGVDTELVAEAVSAAKAAGEVPSDLTQARVEGLPRVLESLHAHDLGGMARDIDRLATKGDDPSRPGSMVRLALTCLAWAGTPQDEPGLLGDLVQIPPQAAATYHDVLLGMMRADPDKRAWDAYRAAEQRVQDWDPQRARELVRQEWKATADKLAEGVELGHVTSRTPTVFAGEETVNLRNSGPDRITALEAPRVPETTSRSWRGLTNAGKSNVLRFARDVMQRQGADVGLRRLTAVDSCAGSESALRRLAPAPPRRLHRFGQIY